MYILFFGGFIIFFDCVNFIMDLNKKNKKKSKTKKEKTHKNLVLRYLQACNERNHFIRINHYLCIVGIFFSVVAQLISLFPWTNVVFLEVIILFLICLLFYLVAYQLARALFLHHKQTNNTIIKSLFFLAFLFVVLSLVGIEMYMVIQYLKFK